MKIRRTVALDRRGLTLMELVVVLVVLGIGVLVVASSAPSTRRPSTTRGSNDSTRVALRRAHAEAIMTGRRVSLVVFVGSERVYASVFPDGRIVASVETQAALPVER